MASRIVPSKEKTTMSNEIKFSEPESTSEFLWDMLAKMLDKQEGDKITCTLKLAADEIAEHHNLSE